MLHGSSGVSHGFPLSSRYTGGRLPVRLATTPRTVTATNNNTATERNFIRHIPLADGTSGEWCCVSEESSALGARQYCKRSRLTLCPPEPSIALPPWREPLADRPSQRDESGSPDCLRVPTARVTHPSAGVTRENRARLRRNSLMPVLPSHPWSRKADIKTHPGGRLHGGCSCCINCGAASRLQCRTWS